MPRPPKVLFFFALWTHSSPTTKQRTLLTFTLACFPPMARTGDSKSPGLTLDLPSSNQSQTSEAAQRVRRSGTVKRNNSAKPDSGYEAGGEEAASPVGAGATPTSDRSGRPAEAQRRVPGSTDSLHSRYSSSDSIFPSRGFARSMSSTSHRSEYASHRPFPTPGIRDRKASRSSSHAPKSATEESAGEEDMADPEMTAFKTAEEKRLLDDADKKHHWKRWGPYLSERQWVRSKFSLIASGCAPPNTPHPSL